MITLYALLRTRFFVDAEVATAALQNRKGSDGAPVANLTYRQAKIHKWIDEVLQEDV